MIGKDLRNAISDDKKVRDYALFGYFGKQMNITDGRYVYMRDAQNRNVQLYEYTLMPTRMSWRMGKELEYATLSKPFNFTKNMPLLKIPAGFRDSAGTDDGVAEYGSQLFDLQSDENELHPINDPELEDKLCIEMARLMIESDAPEELYERMDLTKQKEALQG